MTCPLSSDTRARARQHSKRQRSAHEYTAPSSGLRQHTILPSPSKRTQRYLPRDLHDRRGSADEAHVTSPAGRTRLREPDEHTICAQAGSTRWCDDRLRVPAAEATFDGDAECHLRQASTSTTRCHRSSPPHRQIGGEWTVASRTTNESAECPIRRWCGHPSTAPESVITTVLDRQCRCTLPDTLAADGAISQVGGPSWRVEMDELERRVVRAAEAVLAERRFVSVVDVLVAMRWLTSGELARWRQGRVPDLETVVQVNLSKLSTAMAVLRRWAREQGLHPSETAYLARTRDRRPLRFSRSGDDAIERGLPDALGVVGAVGGQATAAG